MTARKPRGKITARPEQAIQIAAVEFLNLALPSDAVLWATRNEGKRGLVEGGVAKQMGLLPGMPDLCILWRSRFCVIEMKPRQPAYMRGGKPSKHDFEQAQVQNCLREAGAHVAVCWTVDMVENSLRGWGIPLRATVLPSGVVQKEIAE